MNINNEIEKHVKMIKDYEALLKNKKQLKEYATKRGEGTFKIMSDIKEKLKTLNHNLGKLRDAEQIRRAEQSFLSRHKGEIVKTCKTMNTRRTVKVYRYSFGTVYYDRKVVCVDLNNKSYIFDDKEDINFIFTLFKHKKELYEEPMDEVEPLKL